jgi:hypothetical protein
MSRDCLSWPAALCCVVAAVGLASRVGKGGAGAGVLSRAALSGGVHAHSLGLSVQEAESTGAVSCTMLSGKGVVMSCVFVRGVGSSTATCWIFPYLTRLKDFARTDRMKDAAIHRRYTGDSENPVM